MDRTVKSAVRRALEAMGAAPPEHIEIETPKEEAFGDLSTPVAMGLAKALRMPPKKIAEDIAARIRAEEGKWEDAFAGVTVAGPGFINFTFKKDFLFSSLRTLLREKEAFLRRDLGGGRRVLVEFVSANPTGPLHLGHGRGAALGAAVSNLLEAGGYNVERQYYINDAGVQVRMLGLSVYARYQGLLGTECAFPEEGYRGQYIEEIAKAMVNELGDVYRGAGFKEAGEFFIDFSYRTMLSSIREDLGTFGIRFDSWQSERELYGKGAVQGALDYLRARGGLYEEDGALWFRATDFGDEKDRVVIKSDGQHTYFASDIAYHKNKIEGGYDELVNIWGADHHGYVERLMSVIDALGYGRQRLRVLIVQMVTLLRGGKPVQMSKRAGEFVTLREVIEEVGADTTKFMFLTRRPDSHLEFDIELAKASSSENPVYYLQYANARINSIFRHADGAGLGTEEPGEAPLHMLAEKEELGLIKKILAYPMVFEAALRAHEPHRITFYLQELASVFHPYYNKYRIVADDGSLASARLALSKATQIVIREGLGILGVSAPETM